MKKLKKEGNIIKVVTNDNYLSPIILFILSVVSFFVNKDILLHIRLIISMTFFLGSLWVLRKIIVNKKIEIDKKNKILILGNKKIPFNEIEKIDKGIRRTFGKNSSNFKIILIYRRSKNIIGWPPRFSFTIDSKIDEILNFLKENIKT